jgi:hypothetical protein
MLLTDRLKSVASEAAAIRRSLETYDPRAGKGNPAFKLDSGERVIRGRNDPAYLRRVAECARLLSSVYGGSAPAWHLQEAMTTSDFPLLFGDVMYRQMMGNYQTMTPLYPAYMDIKEVNDFRTLHMYSIEGGMARLGGPLKEYEPYPETTFTEGTQTISVAKYGRRYGISFEMLINDDRNAFQTRPALMAAGARFSEEYLALQQIFDANGPHASFFTSGNTNIVTSNAVFGLVGLQTAFTQLAKKVNTDGMPIVIEAATLLVGPALEVPARNLLNGTELRIQQADGTTQLYTQNWMSNRLKLVVNPLIPSIVTAGTVADTAWVLIANNTPMNRPAFRFAFMRGRRDPQLFVKEPNAQMLGGGEISPMEGSFDSDSIDYKVRHIFGAGQGDPNLAIASKGTGS